MCDVALIYPSITFSGDKRENLDAHIYPLGLLYLVSMLEKAGYSVIIFDIADGKMLMDDLIKHIDSGKPRLVEISAMTSNIRGCRLIAKELKGHGEAPQNVDDIPFPARHLIDIKGYKRKGAERSPLIASHGVSLCM